MMNKGRSSSSGEKAPLAVVDEDDEDEDVAVAEQNHGMMYRKIGAPA